MDELELHSVITFPAEQCIPNEFPVVFPPVSYEDFFQTYLAANLPCLIKGGCIDHWRSRVEWADGEGKVDLSSLMDVVPASLSVPVSNCGKRFFNSQEQCRNYTFAGYCRYWRERGDDLLYLKDWHFRRDCPGYAAYRTPNWFCSDWLNEYWDKKCAGDNVVKDDYRFVYIGPKGSWTPFHCDVFGSFSWSANVVGRKKWTFLPPGQQEQLRDEFGNLPHDLNANLKTCDGSSVRKYEVMQESGDIIFVPSLWHHQVVNVEDTISINHNWFNGANAQIVMAELFKALSEVEKELSDCRTSCTHDEWENTCETVLRASHGMNLKDFIDLLTLVMSHRKKAFFSSENGVAMDGYQLGNNHAQFDLDRVNTILTKMKDELLKRKHSLVDNIVEVKLDLC